MIGGLSAGNRSAPRPIVLLAVLGCLTFAAMRALAPDLVNSSPWDIGILLDGAWRVGHGQLPHLDFSSPLGPVTFFLIHLGTLLSGDVVSGLSGGVALAAALLLLFWLATAPLFEDRPLFTAMMVLSFSFMVTPRIIGYPTAIGYVGLYDNFGYGFLTYLLCDVVQAKRDDRAMLRRGVLFGTVAVTAAFTKITFGAAGFLLFVYVLLARTHGRQWAYGVLAGGTAALAAVAVIYGGHVAAIVADYLRMAAIRGQAPVSAPQFAFPQSRMLVAEEIWLAVAVLWAARRRLLTISVLFAGIGVLLALTIDQPAELATLSALSALLALSAYRARASCPWLAVLSLPLVATVGLNLAGAGVSTALLAASPVSASARSYLAQKNVRARILAYADTGEALARVKALGGAHTKLAVVSTNMISPLLGAPPTDGGLLYWDAGLTFSRQDLGRNETLTEGVGDARLILVPTGYDKMFRALVAAVDRVYGDCPLIRAGSWRIRDCTARQPATANGRKQGGGAAP